MEKRYKYVVPYLIKDLTYQKIHPLRNAAFDADLLNSSLIFENHNSGSKNGLW